jgi:hypothetical protein
VQAVRNFVLTYVNWDWSNVSGKLQALAATTVGQARAEMQLEAARAAGDYELEQGEIANSGTIAAVSPMAGYPLTYVVVTIERTTAANTAAYDGLRPAWHVALATVAATKGGGWVVSAWQPES